MKIEMKNTNDLIPYVNNPRKNDGKAVDKVAASIKEFGFKNPIIIDKENVIIAGHTRLKAAKKLGVEEVPTIKADDLTDAQIKAFRIADNRTSQESEWDMDLLKMELDDIDDFDVDVLGFDIGELDFALDEPSEVVEDDFDVDDELGKYAVVKRGQIWRLGRHRLMCGDSTTDDVDVLMDGKKADMVFTDPPYGMFLNTDFSGAKSRLDFFKEKGVTGGRKYENVIGDHSDFKSELITSVLDKFSYCKEIFLWGADYYAELIENKNDGSWVVWDKRLDESADKMYGSTFELCWSKSKHKRVIARVKWAGIFGTEQEFDRKRHHPTQKPVKLANWFFDYFGKDKNLIVDVYGGSGSTLLACEQTNRTCYMMELDEKYCDVIISRWEQLTGEKAVLIGGENDG